MRPMYASKIMTAREVIDTSRKVRALLESGQEIQANIIMLRKAAVKNFVRREDEWQLKRSV